MGRAGEGCGGSTARRRARSRPAARTSRASQRRARPPRASRSRKRERGGRPHGDPDGRDPGPGGRDQAPEERCYDQARHIRRRRAHEHVQKEREESGRGACRGNCGLRAGNCELKMPPVSRSVADCHLHFEGCLPSEEIARLAGRAGHRFAVRGGVRGVPRVRPRRGRVPRALRRSLPALPRPGGLRRRRARGGRRSGRRRRGLRRGLRLARDLHAHRARRRAPASRPWTSDSARPSKRAGSCAASCSTPCATGAPKSADRVLDLYERNPLPSIVGFGMGGDEAALPAAAFGGIYLRARALGLHTSVHAGEWVGAESVRDVLDALRPDRLDHGIAAAADPLLLARLAEEDTILCVAPTSNLRTGAVGSAGAHPLKRLLDAGRPRHALGRRPRALRHDDPRRVPLRARAARPDGRGPAHARGQRLARGVLHEGRARRGAADDLRARRS